MAASESIDQEPHGTAAVRKSIAAGLGNKPVMRQLEKEGINMHPDLGHHHAHRPTCVAVAPGNRALTTDDHGQVSVWDLSTLKKIRDLGAHGGKASYVTVAGERAFSAGFDGTVSVWDLRTYKRIREFAGHRGGTSPSAGGPEVWVVAVSFDGRQTVSATNGGQILLWEIEREAEPTEFFHSQEPVGGLAFVPGDGSRFVSGHADGAMRLWDTSKPSAPVHEFSHGNSHPVNSVAAMPNGTAVSASFDMTLIVWDLQTGRQVHRLHGPGGHQDIVWRVAVSPDGTKLASASEDGTVKVWDARTGAPLKSFPASGKGLMGVDFLDDQRIVYTGDGSRADVLIEPL